MYIVCRGARALLFPAILAFHGPRVERRLCLDVSTPLAWKGLGGWQGSKGDKKWINVSLSHSLIYFKSKPYLHTAHRQALSAPTSIEIFKTINAVQRQPERVWDKLLLCETEPGPCQSFLFLRAGQRHERKTFSRTLSCKKKNDDPFF